MVKPATAPTSTPSPKKAARAGEYTSNMVRLKTLAEAAHAEDMGKDARAILQMMAIHADPDAGFAWPSKELIGRLTGYGEKTVATALTRACAAGLLLKLQPEAWTLADPRAVKFLDKATVKPPIYLVWPAATHLGRFRALAALCENKPYFAEKIPPQDEILWRVDVGDGREQGPWPSSQMREILAANADASEWKLWPEGEPRTNAHAPGWWFHFGMMLRKAPPWAVEACAEGELQRRLRRRR